LLVSLASCCTALHPARLSVIGSAAGQTHQPAISRREAVIGAAAAAVAATLLPAPVLASGGATAGKTTSIPRAKLRYYGRMTAVVTAYQALETAIRAGTAKQAAASFFSEEDEAPLAELRSAGYLLAVAFKIDSKIPPDKIQQVKVYKKMMKEFESLKSAMKSGKSDPALEAFAATTASFNVYLEGVELPPIGDARYSPHE